MTTNPNPSPTAVWVDGDPLMEAIAAAVWEQCGRSDSGSCVEDDPRTIAAVAAAVSVPPPAPRADDRGALRDRIAAAVYEHMHPGSHWSDTSMPEDWRPAYLDEADAVLAVLPEPADQAAALAEDLRYVLGNNEPRHAHEQPGVWDTSGKPCGHCARLAVAQANLAAYDGEQPVGPCVAGEQQNETPETDDEALRAKVDDATATLRRVRSVVKLWEQQTLPHSQARQLLTEVRDALAGPRPDPETDTEPTDEQIVREHVTTVHLIGEQLAGIESWMWEHLANVRDAAKAEPAAGVRQDGAQQ